MSRTRAQVEWELAGILRGIVTGTVRPRDGLRELVAAHHTLPQSETERFVGAEYGIAEFIGIYYGYDDLEERPHEVSFEGKYGPQAFPFLDAEVVRLARVWIDELGA
jgi:hypothetical protein